MAAKPFLSRRAWEGWRQAGEVESVEPGEQPWEQDPLEKDPPGKEPRARDLLEMEPQGSGLGSDPLGLLQWRMD